MILLNPESNGFVTRFRKGRSVSYGDVALDVSKKVESW